MIFGIFIKIKFTHLKENWRYKKNKSFTMDIKLIFLTIWVIIFPKSNLYNIWFRNLPNRGF